MKKVVHPSVEDRVAQGKAARERAAPADHGGWEPAPDRPDPVALLEEQNTTREPDLVPVRHGRMMVSPFTFYRGAAKIMAADLKDTPTAGLNAQLCGCTRTSPTSVCTHRPSARSLFDLNDFDETLPGPFEYDVKRLAASFTIAGAEQRLPQGRCPCRHASVGERVPDRDDRVRRDADAGDLVRPRVGTGSDARRQ